MSQPILWRGFVEDAGASGACGVYTSRMVPPETCTVRIRGLSMGSERVPIRRSGRVGGRRGCERRPPGRIVMACRLWQREGRLA